MLNEVRYSDDNLFDKKNNVEFKMIKDVNRIWIVVLIYVLYDFLLVFNLDI